ncbi:MAG TPA: hypothetical protein VMU67_12580 [Steroidobacteraceae bacterium]|nr:hypothetical protein [Steroidobacteraceae bacterium]
MTAQRSLTILFAAASVISVGSVCSLSRAGNYDASTDLAKQAHNAGFKVRTSGGKTYYCKKDTDIGTRLPQETCYDPDQFKLFLIAQQQNRDALNGMAGQANYPASGGGK